MTSNPDISTFIGYVETTVNLNALCSSLREGFWDSESFPVKRHHAFGCKYPPLTQQTSIADRRKLIKEFFFLRYSAQNKSSNFPFRRFMWVLLFPSQAVGERLCIIAKWRLHSYKTEKLCVLLCLSAHSHELSCGAHCPVVPRAIPIILISIYDNSTSFLITMRSKFKVKIGLYILIRVRIDLYPLQRPDLSFFTPSHIFIFL